MNAHHSDSSIANLTRLAFLLLTLAVSLAHAGEADVVDVKVRRSAPGVYDFDITVRSVDKGWDYYADAFEVLAPDGKLLGRRELLHPHETEQPFTRDLYGVRIPSGVTEVVIRARHKPRDYDGKSIRIRLPER